MSRIMNEGLAEKANSYENTAGKLTASNGQQLGGDTGSVMFHLKARKKIMGLIWNGQSRW